MATPIPVLGNGESVIPPFEIINHLKDGALQHDGTFANGPAKAVPYPKAPFELVDRYIDEPRRLRVVVIGGGLAGIEAGALLPAKVPGLELTIYEKNPELGGTWYENVYPGVRCDIPSHVYQSTFSPSTQWSDEFAPGAEIRDYWQSVAKKYNVYQYAKLSHKVDELNWNGDGWQVTVTNLSTGEKFVDVADFVLTCIGRFNAWKLPNYPGMSEFKGILRHASHWDPSFDPTGKKVAVIGNGASGIQLSTNLQKTASKLNVFARSKTWIAGSWAGDERTLEPQPIPDELKASFKDPDAYLAFRKNMEDKYWRKFSTFLQGESNDKLRQFFIESMKSRLTKKPELAEQLIPQDFAPNCRRLTPGPGYLEALQEDNVEYIQTRIKRFTETGIETEDGVLRDIDACFCATGANGTMIPPFPIRANDQELAKIWARDGPYGFPYTYLGASTPGFPNLLFVHGPHGTGPSGTVPHSVESQLTYYAKILRKVGREGIKSIVPQKAATDEFVAYCDSFFNKTVMQDCSSWYNGGQPGARIHGIWPGSSLHCTLVRREPRWEDFEYEYLEESKGNRFRWYFGNGASKKELSPGSDMVTYLHKDGTVDIRDVHESWWLVP
ncbi:4-hydroxyacetophenone monooxygenase [Coniella lustricola]|uniref:4-hydroxyacetophenone monooxygenase n=1 Tax=Coniella lustricola TaxID=2025994 RepID=A0A2T3A9X6_9PEZI|nr:4-hydroxyacetophenone monooxygenase [Coniella lustricola]